MLQALKLIVNLRRGFVSTFSCMTAVIALMSGASLMAAELTILGQRDWHKCHPFLLSPCKRETHHASISEINY